MLKQKEKKVYKPWQAILILLLFGLGVAGFVFAARAYSGSFKVAVELKQVPADLREPIRIEFSEPVLVGDANNKIKLFPATEIELVWSSNRRTLEIFPREGWQLATTYMLNLQDLKSVLWLPVEGFFEFKTVDLPQVLKTIPQSGSENVLPSMEQPLEVTFDQSLADFAVKITVIPRVELAYQLSEGQKTIKFLPKTDLQKGQTYVVQMKIKHKQEEEKYLRVLEEWTFKTEDPEPEMWDKNPETRLLQAKKYTKPRITTGKYVDINLRYQVMTIFENGLALDAYLISSGKKGMDTPEGTFQISNKARKPWSKKYALFMPYWMALVSSGEFGIHELPEWPGGFKEGQNHLGIPVSHGCVRLGVGPAQRVFDWAEIGTPVAIHK